MTLPLVVDLDLQGLVFQEAEKGSRLAADTQVEGLVVFCWERSWSSQCQAMCLIRL